MEHARLVQAAGGTFNGSTHQDYTNYYEALPAEALERALFLEADRMAAPAITEENLRNQIDVVKEEIRVNVLNRPYGAFPWLQLPQIAFESFANTHDGYGSFVDLESSTVDDATDFFSRYYAPGNAVLCIGGDLDVAETERLVQRWFGPVEARAVPPIPPTGEPLPTAVRSAVVEDALAHRAGRSPSAGGCPTRSATSTATSAPCCSPSCSARATPPAWSAGWCTTTGSPSRRAATSGSSATPSTSGTPPCSPPRCTTPPACPPSRVLAAVHEEVARVATDGVGADELRPGPGPHRGPAAAPGRLGAGPHPRLRRRGARPRPRRAGRRARRPPGRA